MYHVLSEPGRREEIHILLSEHIWSILLFSGALQGVVLATALLFNRRGRKLANVILSGIVLSSVATIVPWFLIAMEKTYLGAGLLYVDLLMTATIGPLFYYYTRSLLSSDYKPRLPGLLLFAFLPGVVRAAHWLLQGVDPTGLTGYVSCLKEGMEFYFSPLGFSMASMQLLYATPFLFLAWRHIKKTETRIKNDYPAAECRHLRWLKIVTVVLVLMGMQGAAMFAQLLITRWYTIETEYSFPVVRCLFIQFVAVSALFMPEGFTATIKDVTTRKRRPPIGDQAADEYAKRLRDFMRGQRPYKNEALRLPDLAEMVGLTPHALSQLINERLGMNFLDFLNKYRVEEAQRLLQLEENDQFTLLAVAREAGFNSKAPFNRAFKKFTGVSPSDYRRAIRCPELPGSISEIWDQSAG